MVAKQTEKTIYRTVDKNTQDKNTVKNTRYMPDTKSMWRTLHCQYFHTGLRMYECSVYRLVGIDRFAGLIGTVGDCCAVSGDQVEVRSRRLEPRRRNTPTIDAVQKNTVQGDAIIRTMLSILKVLKRDIILLWPVANQLQPTSWSQHDERQSI